MMYQDFIQLERLDSQGNAPENLFINGSISEKRLADSVITPPWVSAEMIRSAELDANGLKILEPCAGRGGILNEIVFAIEKYKLTNKTKIFFNEKEVDKKADLIKTYRGKSKLLEPLPVTNSLEYRYGSVEKFDRIIMNPPFDEAHRFIYNLSERVEPGGRLVSLFPKYQLSRVTSFKNFILRLLASKELSIKDLPDFNCGYGAKVCMITIQF